jgi:glycosyltransferase involved in cell wall biosynthesis
VGGTPRYKDIFNKGFDLIFSVAALEPDWHFVLIGIDIQWMPGLERDFAISSLRNVVILPAIPHEEVLDLMQTSSIYVQPSISEGMPNALMEAMIHGCIPVGSNVAGIPTLIGDWGVIFYQRKAADFRAAIQLAMDLHPDRQAISNSIRERFNPIIRQQALLENLRKLADSKKS